MINYKDEFQPALLSLRNVLKDLRYDWIYRSIKGLSYFADSSLNTIAPTISEQMTSVSLKHNVAIRLLALGEAVSQTEVKEIFPENLINELLSLGLLVNNDEIFHLDGCRIIAWLGFYVISTNPVIQPDTNLTAEQYRLAYELMNLNGNTAMDLNCGCGLATLVAAERMEKVFAFSDNLTAINITAANLALNGLKEKVSLDKIPVSLSDLPKADLVFSSYSEISLPKTIKELFGNELNNRDSLNLLQQLETLNCKNIKIVAQLLGAEEVSEFTHYLRSLIKESLEVKVFVLSRNYMPSLYFETLAEIIRYRLQYVRNCTELPLNNILDEIKSYYETISAKCIYLILIEAAKTQTTSFEIVNFASDLTSQDTLDIPRDIELLEKEVLTLQLEKPKVQLQISEIEKTIIDLIKEDDSILLKEIAEKLAKMHNISFESAGAKIIEFCHQLFLQGLLSNPAMSSLRGQMRQMAINVNKFANTLTSIGKELDKE